MRPYVMKAPGPVQGRRGGEDGEDGDGADGPPALHGSAPPGSPGVPDAAPGESADAGGGEPRGAVPGEVPGGAAASGTPPSAVPAGTGPGPHTPGTPLPDGTLAVPYAPIGAPPEGPADADLGLFADDSAAARAPGDPYGADYADYADYGDDSYDPYDADGPRGPRDPGDRRGPYGPRRPRDRLAARRRRRLTLVLTVGGVVAALSVGLLGSGLFTGDGDDDRAVPKPDTITAVPTGGGTKPGPEDTRSGVPTAPADGEDPAEPSATASDRAGSGEGDPGEEPTERAEAGQVTAAPPGSGTTAPGDDPTSGTTAPGGRDEPAPPPTLREGDSGPEVLELQKRLIEAGYNNLPGNTDGDFDWLTVEAVARFQNDNDVGGDERGVYGPATRRALESMTKEP